MCWGLFLSCCSPVWGTFCFLSGGWRHEGWVDLWSWTVYVLMQMVYDFFHFFSRCRCVLDACSVFVCLFFAIDFQALKLMKLGQHLQVLSYVFLSYLLNTLTTECSLNCYMYMRKGNWYSDMTKSDSWPVVKLIYIQVLSAELSLICI